MISLLLNLLILCLIFGVVYWAITLIPMPAPFKQVALVILAVILVIVLISMLTGGGFGLPLGREWR